MPSDGPATAWSRTKTRRHVGIVFTDGSVLEADFAAASGQQNRLVARRLGALVLDVLAQSAAGDSPLLLDLLTNRKTNA